MKSLLPPFPARLLAVASALLIAACASLPEAAQKPEPLGPNFAHAVAPASTAAPALDDWWQGFHDPVLSDLVGRALAQNLDLAAALARVDQARAAAQAAGALALPQVGIQGSLLRQRQSLKSPEGALASAFPGYEREQTLQTLGIGASWEADLGRGLDQGKVAAQADWRAAEAARSGAQVRIVAEVADAYFRLRGAQARLAVAEDQLGTQQQLLTLVQDRLDHGLGTQREREQARGLLQQARGALPPLRTEESVQLHRLDVLLGQQAGFGAASLQAASVVPVATIPSLPADITPAQLLARRPDVIAAEARVDATQARIGVARAEYYPHVTLGALLGGQSLHGALFSADAFQPQALLGLRWRLFDFGRVDAEVAQARGARAEALAGLRLRMLQATEEVENALVLLAGLEAQQAELVQEVDAHRRARDAAADAYRGGALSLIEVLEEDRLLLSANDQLARLQADRARAAVAAFRALGGGWTAPQG